MESASGQVGSLSFDSEALGQSQRWVVHHRGLEYSGEVIVAETVNPAWALPLEGNLSFRIVFLTVPRRIGRLHIQDPRTAMAVPGRLPAQIGHLGMELRSIREARAQYITARERDSDVSGLRGAIQERETSVRDELTRRYAAVYSQGHINTRAGVTLHPRDIFLDEIPESWADRLASALLLSAHPSLPLDHGSFPETLTSECIEALFRVLFQGEEDSMGVARGFGPGLGLTRREAHPLFDAGECPALVIIQSHLESRAGEVPADEMLRVLTLTHGLTQPLAALYLMAFVRQAHAEVELAPDHRIKTRQGERFLGDRITWDLVPEVLLSESLVNHLGVARLQPAPTWDTILPYATLLLEGLTPSDDATAIANQERRLLDHLTTMSAELATAREAAADLEASLDRTPAGDQEALQKLGALCAVSDHREFYSVCQESFGGPAGLSEALALRERLTQLVARAPAIAQAKRSLDQMTFDTDHQWLLLQRDALASRIEPDSLMANPLLWGSIEGSFRRLRAEYIKAYEAHHRRYHQEALKLSHRLEGLRPQVEALARLNDIPELGEPVGTEILGQFQQVTGFLSVCSIGEGELSLDDVPHCRACSLRLDAEVQRRDAELLLGAVERALREYNRRLSSHSVRQILAHPSREQLDKFINLVQVADSSALANVLDDEVMEFLRQFLRSA